MEPRVGLQLRLRCDSCRKQFTVFLSPDQMAGMARGMPDGHSTVRTLCDDCVKPAGFGYTRSAGDRVRFGIEYGGIYRNLFWIRVSQAGDVYCTFGYGEHLEGAWTVQAPVVGQSATVKYGVGEDEVRGPLKGGRVSFHASGQINLGDRQLKGKPLEARDSQELLCTLVFEHPSAFPRVVDPGAKDVLVPLAIDEQRALVGTVHLIPPNAPLVLDTGVRELGEPRWHSVIRYEGLAAQGVSEVAVQVVLGQGPNVEEWPPKSYLLVDVPDSGPQVR
jgi:hypothetical protein